jgi:Arc/MetJ-type ribon-helix-helix transcriptional regulator
VNINVNKEIVPKLQERVDSTDEFENVEEYVNYVLVQITEKLKKETQNLEMADNNSKDEEEAKQKLRDLGYLD